MANKKIVLITGASSGIGKATAKKFAKKGYDLIITGRRKQKLQNLKQQLEQKYAAKIQILSFDVQSYAACKKAFKSLSKQWQDIDILVNNAGLALGYSTVDAGDINDWQTMMNTNVMGILHMTKIVSKQMIKKNKGHIINICSTAGHEVYPNGNAYCASKHAVMALTKSMRLDFYKHGIRVSQVSPGHVEETEFALVRFHGNTERSKIYEDFQPLKSKDVANIVIFIAEQAHYVNIQDVLVMGTQQANSNYINRSGR